jgi:hypothetical protein
VVRITDDELLLALVAVLVDAVVDALVATALAVGVEATVGAAKGDVAAALAEVGALVVALAAVSAASAGEGAPAINKSPIEAQHKLGIRIFSTISRIEERRAQEFIQPSISEVSATAFFKMRDSEYAHRVLKTFESGSFVAALDS